MKDWGWKDWLGIFCGVCTILQIFYWADPHTRIRMAVGMCLLGLFVALITRRPRF